MIKYSTLAGGLVLTLLLFAQPASSQSNESPTCESCGSQLSCSNGDCTIFGPSGEVVNYGGSKLDKTKPRRVPDAKADEVVPGKLGKTRPRATKPRVDGAEVTPGQLDKTRPRATEPWIDDDQATPGQLDRTRPRATKPRIDSDDVTPGKLDRERPHGIDEPSADVDPGKLDRTRPRATKPRIDDADVTPGQLDRDRPEATEPWIDSDEVTPGQLDRTRPNATEPYIRYRDVDPGKLDGQDTTSAASGEKLGKFRPRSTKPRIGDVEISIGIAEPTDEERTPPEIDGGDADPGYLDRHDAQRVGEDPTKPYLMIRYTQQGGLAGINNELKIFSDGKTLLRMEMLGVYAMYRMYMSEMETDFLHCIFQAGHFNQLPQQYFPDQQIIDGLYFAVSYCNRRGQFPRTILSETGAVEDIEFRVMRAALDRLMEEITSGRADVEVNPDETE
jgi:hypothetical protein